MSFNRITKHTKSLFFFMLCLFSVVMSSHGHAKMMSNTELLNQQHDHYSQQQLQAALQSPEIRQKLAAMGVNSEQLDQRVARLSAEEIQQLNQKMQDDPAGQGVVGALLFIFVVFIVTDMLCATDIFNFVNCIN